MGQANRPGHAEKGKIGTGILAAAGRAATALLLLAPAHGMAAGSLVTDPDFVDNKFESYYLRPCLDGPGTLLARGWTAQEINEYNTAICAAVFNAGTFNSTDTYASTSNIGSVGAQSKTSDSVAQQQVESVQDRLDEIKEEEERPKGGWGLLLSAQRGETERVSTNNEVGYDSDLDGVVVGVDYRFGAALIVGAAAGVTTDDADFEGGAGSIRTESRSLMVYATYALNDNAYIDGYVGYAPLDYSSKRDVSVDGEVADAFGFTGVVSADFEGKQTLAGISAGYDWYPGKFAYGVFGALDFSKTDVDGYEEDGITGLELEYPDQSSKSLTLRLGVTGSYTVDMGWGAMIPNVSVSAVHEQENDAREFDARLLVMPDVDTTSLTLETDKPDREYVLTSLGIVFALNNGSQIFVTYEEMSSNDFLETSTLSAGFLAEF